MVLKRLIGFSAIVPFFVLVLFFGACSEKKSEKKINYAAIKEPLISANERFVRKESDEIDAYVASHHWQVEKTATGIRYQFLQHGKGPLAQKGQYIKMAFSVHLLDGTLCYTSDKLGAKTFLIGEDHVESGLHEMALLLTVGDQLKVILPSYLAFGLTGDGAKIPPRAAVVYDLQVLGIHD